MSYKIISKYLKDISFEIPDAQSFVMLEKEISNYILNSSKEMRGEKLPPYWKPMIYTVRPLFFAIGWLVKKKILSKTEV